MADGCALVRDHGERQPRRLARPARRRDPLGRVPRPGRRQADRARRVRGAGRPRRVPVVGGCARRRARARHQRVPVGRGPARRRAARAAARQVQGVHAVLRRRIRAAAADGRLRRAAADSCSTSRLCSRSYPGCRSCGAATSTGNAPIADSQFEGAGECGVRSSRSEPSCCSARSSTRTVRGSASSSPRRASIRTSTGPIGDNQARIVAALRDQLSRSDAVLICGGLGPTQDDLTRDAIAELMGVPLVRHDELAETIAQMFRARVRDMPQNNLRQADIPEGGEAIPNPDRYRAGSACASSPTARSSTRFRACRTR